jgi:hypothetical protein
MSNEQAALVAGLRRKSTFFRRFKGEGKNEVEILLTQAADCIESLAAQLATAKANALWEAANGLQFIRISRMDRRSRDWWVGLDDAERVLRARADSLTTSD